MRSFITHQITNLPIVSLVVGGCLVLNCQYQPAQAQIVKNQLFLAQTAASNFYESPVTQQTLPQLPQTEAVEFYQNNQNYQTYPTTQISQYGQNLGKYIVYVDSDDTQILQRVRQIERSAYIHQVNGRNIIQSGVFSKPSNAQQRVRELELNGIGAGILDLSNPEQISSASGSSIPSSRYYRGDYFTNGANSGFQREQGRYYYVIIPTNYKNLDFLGKEIQRKINVNANVFMRTEPRGAHIAVGGFQERQKAEQWNDYLRSLGYGNARVYYGR